MPLRVTARQLQACGILRKLGMHTKGSGAAVGNFVQECGINLDTTMYRAHPDASGGVQEDLKSGGIAEWLGDRKLACIAFSRAKEAKLSLPHDFLLNDLETQCEFVVHELKYGESGDNQQQYEDLWRQLTTETLDSFGRPRSIATLTANFMVMYERPQMGAGTDKLGEVRIPYAEAIADRYELIEEAEKPEAQPAPTAPLPQVPGPKIPVPVPPLPTVPVDRPAPHVRPPISASTAALQAAMRDTFEAEIESRLAEVAVFREILASLDTLSTAPPLLALPPPAGSPNLNPVMTPQKRTSQMNEQALSALRSTLLALGGAAVSMGVLDNATMTTIIGAVMVVVPGAWSLWRHRQAGTIAAAAALPDVKQIVTTPAIANSPEFAENPTVVGQSTHRL